MTRRDRWALKPNGTLGCPRPARASDAPLARLPSKLLPCSRAVEGQLFDGPNAIARQGQVPLEQSVRKIEDGTDREEGNPGDIVHPKRALCFLPAPGDVVALRNGGRVHEVEN